MRVLHLNAYSWGSTGTIANSVHQKLLENGVPSLFAYGFRNGNEPTDDEFVVGNSRDHFRHAVYTLLSGKHGYCSKATTKRLIAKIQAFNPTIIHLHNLHGGYLNLKTLFDYLKTSDATVCVTLHDCWLFTGKCYHFYQAGCEKWKIACRDCPQLRMYPKSYFFDRTRSMFRDKKKWITRLDNLEVVAVSKWLADVAKQSFLGKYRVQTIYNGIDAKKFCRRDDFDDLNERLGISGKFVVLGVAQSWNKHKGIDDFIELSRRLKDDEVVVFVGELPRDLTLPRNCVSVGVLTDANEMVKLYSRADVFLNCSAEETFGMVTAEALACGTPAICYDATACAEVLDDQVGFRLAPGDLDGIRTAIDKMRSGERRFDPKRCADKIKARFTKEKMVEDYLALYRRIESERRVDKR